MSELPTPDPREPTPADQPAAPVASAEPEAVVTGWRRLVFGRNLRRTLIRILILTAFNLVLFRVILLPIRVTGQSMMPTYQNGQINFINTLAYLSQTPRRGDVVAVYDLRHDVLMKRVVGLPGESVAIRRGRIFIGNKALDEPYAMSQLPVRDRVAELKTAEYFVVGDNRAVTVYGIVPSTNIIGKLLF